MFDFIRTFISKINYSTYEISFPNQNVQCSLSLFSPLSFFTIGVQFRFTFNCSKDRTSKYNWAHSRVTTTTWTPDMKKNPKPTPSSVTHSAVSMPNSPHTDQRPRRRSSPRQRNSNLSGNLYNTLFVTYYRFAIYVDDMYISIFWCRATGESSSSQFSLWHNKCKGGNNRPLIKYDAF